MASITPLHEFGFLAVSGRDAAKFLQGYITCNLDSLHPGKSRIGAVCNLQGRMVSSARLALKDGVILLRMHRDLVQPTMDFLQKYIVFSKAEMADVSGQYHCYGIIGEVDDAAVEAGGVTRREDGLLVTVGPARFELWSTAGHIDGEADLDAWATAEVDAGIAWVGAATAESFIPQMFGYHQIGAIDFDKGCYLGQEIVARMQYRGNLNRRLFRAALAGAHVGDTLMAGGKVAGTIVAAAPNACLAVVQSKDDGVPDVTTAGGEAVRLEAVSIATD